MPPEEDAPTRSYLLTSANGVTDYYVSLVCILIMITRTVPSIHSTHLLVFVTPPISKRRIGKTVTTVRPGASRCYGINELYVFEHLFLFIHDQAPYKSNDHGPEKRPSRHACSPVRRSVVKRYIQRRRGSRGVCVFVSSITL